MLNTNTISTVLNNPAQNERLTAVHQYFIDGLQSLVLFLTKGVFVLSLIVVIVFLCFIISILI
jgi:hypothetical protein